jgi:hypothetical protein
MAKKKLTISAEMNVTGDAIASNFLQRCTLVATGGQGKESPIIIQPCKQVYSFKETGSTENQPRTYATKKLQSILRKKV